MTFRRGLLLVAVSFTVGACVYYNKMYDTETEYDRAIDAARTGSNTALVHYDSVIAKAGRLVSEHPDSHHAAPAALLKARAEIARGYWDAVVETTSGVADLTEDPAQLGIAAGLEAIARSEFGEYAEAERLLTRALDAEPPAEDRALFHFHRGLARLELGQPERAAADLEAVAGTERLPPEVQLDLARGLSEVGQHDAAIRLTDRLIEENPTGTFDAGMDPHLDSLVRRAPEALGAAFAARLDDGEPVPTRRAMLQYYRALGRELLGDTTAALALYDSARANGAQGRYGAEASYRWARLRMAAAARPDDLLTVREALSAGRRVPEADVSRDADRLAGVVEEFGHLLEAYRTRGGTAAEAALRAAELAGAELGARRVARGLYLRYLDLAPTSTWQAKAIGGAMLHAEWQAGQWASDEGPTTDARLRTRLAELPPSDPYRVSLLGLERDAAVDSAYARAERDLWRRIVEIRMLYDTTAVLVQPTDTAEADDGEDEEDDGPDAPPDVEF